MLGCRAWAVVGNQTFHSKDDQARALNQEKSLGTHGVPLEEPLLCQGHCADYK